VSPFMSHRARTAAGHTAARTFQGGPVQLASYAISCWRCSEGTVGQLAGHLTVLAIGRKTLAPATIETVFCPGDNNSGATRS
jgi:hypothetical protein